MLAVIGIIFAVVIIVALVVVGFCIFFDQAILTRRETIYRVKTKQKIVALTFDDGPSPEWTPKILDELKKANIKATFFMIGHHVKKYPEVARRVAAEGHTIGNHTYAHSVIFYYTPEEVEEEIKYTELIVKEVTGQRTKFFRPPKAWIMNTMKDKVKSMGYEVILWSLNSKDWVTFDDKYMVRYILRNIRNGDILLFHDSGGVFKTEGGNRCETVSAIPLLAEKLKERGFKFVTVDELLNGQYND